MMMTWQAWTQRQSSARYLQAILGAALLIRLLALLLLAPTLDFSREGNAIHGSEAYDAYAQNLLASGVYGRVLGVPDAQIPPLYSVALALVYGLFGRGFVQVGLFHIALDLASMALLYDSARRLFAPTGRALWGRPWGEWIGLGAALAFAGYPYLIFQNLTLIDTPFWITLLHLFVWLMILLRERPTLDGKTWALAALAGLVLGLATLTRPITPLLAALLGLWLWTRLSLAQAVLRLLPVATLSLAIMSLWIARNYGIFGAFVPMTTTSGANLWQGNSVWTIPVFRAGYDVQWTAPDVQAPRDSREADAERFALALAYWRDNPDRLLELFWVKFLVHWSIDIAPRFNPQEGEQWRLSPDGQLIIVQAETSIEGVTSANTSYNQGLLDTIGRPVHLLYYGTLFLLACIGFGLSWRDWREASLLWAVQFSMTFIYVLFHPSTRYRAPSDPLLFVLSAYALVTMLSWWQARAKRA
ncbi:MAG: glycosyltransferase family 39 protein [Anaerolineae bacterium]|nr:glycosyltransferase family 39 protein [Anaerolineae bacterium]MDW8173605.1 hypothetical protein [Anaerolineae bacterium]